MRDLFLKDLKALCVKHDVTLCQGEDENEEGVLVPTGFFEFWGQDFVISLYEVEEELKN